MQYHGGKLCISMHELVDGGIMTEANYKQMARRKKFKRAQKGQGAGNMALVIVETLPTQYREAVELKFGKGEEVLMAGWIRENYHRDQTAVAWFNDRRNHSVEFKDEEKRRKWVEECVVNASVLNCCQYLYENATLCQRLAGETYKWEKMADAVKSLREQFGHTLPTSMVRLLAKLNKYRKEGYASLISGKFGNQTARRMTCREERVIVSIACLKNQPFNTTVREMYVMFLAGDLDVWDYGTGELYDPDTFAKKNGEPWVPSDATVTSYLNKPKNKIIIENAHRSRMAFYHEQMPYMHRHSGEFSLSQITMDDVDLSRTMKGNERVHAYYAYDVVSQCVIGAAYGREKKDPLVVDCFRDMFRLIERHGWGMPAGIEVEQHLMSKYKDGFLRAGVAFPFVHFCAPQNSQEKYSEQLNGGKKKSVIHKNHTGIGRFYGKGKWRKEYEKVSDEFNDTYNDYEYFTWEQLVAEDRADNDEWNNALHPNQKKYPGLTRWQVLQQNINPTLAPLDKITLNRYIGERVETSVRRNSTVRVAYEDWWLSGPEILEQLEPNNYKVVAYYLPDEEGKPTDVYIFQNDRYIDKVERIVTYNRVYAEQTEEDKAAFTEQQKKVSRWRKYVNDNAAPKIGIAMRARQAESEPEIEELTIEIPATRAEEVEDSRFNGVDYEEAGLANF